MTKRTAATAKPSSLGRLLDGATDGTSPPPAPMVPASEDITPPVGFFARPPGTHDTPAQAALADIPMDALMSWWMPLFRTPGRAPRPDLVGPYAVLFVAAALARGQKDRTIRLELVALRFPPGFATASASQLHGLGLARVDHAAGTITILKTPVAL